MCCSDIRFNHKTGWSAYGTKPLKFANLFSSGFVSIYIRFCFDDCDFIAALLSHGKWQTNTNDYFNRIYTIHSFESRFVIIVLSLYFTLHTYRTEREKEKRSCINPWTNRKKIVVFISGRCRPISIHEQKLRGIRAAFFRFFHTATSFRLKIGWIPRKH